MKNGIVTTATEVAPPSVRQGTNFSSQSIPGQLFDGGGDQNDRDVTGSGGGDFYPPNHVQLHVVPKNNRCGSFGKMRTQAVAKLFAKKCELRMYKDGDSSELKASNRLTKNHVEHVKL